MLLARAWLSGCLPSAEIPKDVSVIGFDDSPIASRVWPLLTTVVLPIREMGRIAASRLRGDVDPSDPLNGVEVSPVLVVRNSVAPPRRPTN